MSGESPDRGWREALRRQGAEADRLVREADAAHPSLQLPSKVVKQAENHAFNRGALGCVVAFVVLSATVGSLLSAVGVTEGVVGWVVLLGSLTAAGVVFGRSRYRALDAAKTQQLMKEEQWAATQAKQRAESEAAFAEARAVIALHAQALATRRAQLLIPDSYGVVDREAWKAEMWYFAQRVLEPAMTDKAFGHVEFKTDALIEEAADVIDEQRHSRGVPTLGAVAQLTGIEFEHACAELLRQRGWDVRLTRATGDQGADLIAVWDPYRVVLQCKRHGRPVGNSAVQEVLGAVKFEGGTHGVVVTNASFTKAAQALAQRANVLLLNVRQLGELRMMLDSMAERN